MRTILLINSIVFIIIGSMIIYIGVDLKKRTSWLWGAYGLISGFLVGLLWADLVQAILIGIIFTFVIMYGGAITHWHRQRFK